MASEAPATSGRIQKPGGKKKMRRGTRAGRKIQEGKLKKASFQQTGGASAATTVSPTSISSRDDDLVLGGAVAIEGTTVGDVLQEGNSPAADTEMAERALLLKRVKELEAANKDLNFQVATMGMGTMSLEGEVGYGKELEASDKEN